MSARTNSSGVACCGNCGSELKVACTGGCAEPDIVFKENYIASLPKPRGEEKPQDKPRSGQCRSPNCSDDIAPHSGRGRSSTHCARHLEMRNSYRKKAKSKLATEGAIAA